MEFLTMHERLKALCVKGNDSDEHLEVLLFKNDVRQPVSDVTLAIKSDDGEGKAVCFSVKEFLEIAEKTKQVIQNWGK